MSSQLKPIIAAKTDVGFYRDWNEDSIFSYVSPSNNCALLIIADGMGGILNGESIGKTASQLVTDTLSQELSDLFQTVKSAEREAKDLKFGPEYLTNRLHLAIDKANVKLTEHIQQKRASKSEYYRSSISGLVIALVQNKLAIIANVADCRAYHFRDNHLHLITNNVPIQLIGPPHVVLSYGKQLGQGAKIQVNGLPQSSVELTDVDKSEFDLSVQLYLGVQSLQAGDRLLLCSDGLWGEIFDDTKIRELLAQSLTPEEAAQRLIDVANAEGGQDNISVIVCDMVEDRFDLSKQSG